MIGIENCNSSFSGSRKGGNVGEGALAICFRIFPVTQIFLDAKNTLMINKNIRFQCCTVCSVTFSSLGDKNMLNFEVMQFSQYISAFLHDSYISTAGMGLTDKRRLPTTEIYPKNSSTYDSFLLHSLKYSSRKLLVLNIYTNSHSHN